MSGQLTFIRHSFLLHDTSHPISTATLRGSQGGQYHSHPADEDTVLAVPRRWLVMKSILGSSDLKARMRCIQLPRVLISLRGRQCYPHLTQGCCRTNEKALTLTSRVTPGHPLTHSLFSFCFFHYAGHKASPTACR